MDANDTWQRAVLGLACVSNRGDHAHSVLMHAIRTIENLRLDAEIVDYHIEVWRGLQPGSEVCYN